jgi:hypothetical protein
MAPETTGKNAKSPEESPIQLSRAACPVCRTVNEFETVRAGAYVEEGTDTDFRPLGRRWLNPRYQSVNPLLYFMATCTTCFYTRESNRILREPSSEAELPGDHQKHIRLKHFALLADSSSVARRLGSSLWPESFPIETAISKLLLGILDENLVASPSNYDLARWYLRAAWLFREAQPHDRADLMSAPAQSRRDLRQALDDVSDDLMRLRARVGEIAQFLQRSPEAAAKHVDDSQGPLECRLGLQQALDNVETLAQTINDIRLPLIPAPDQFVGGHEHSDKEAFGDHASYTEFLRLLKLDSPLVPINEEEALERSLSHYKQAFDAHGGIDAKNGAMLTAYLIGELSRRLSRFEDAERYLDMARAAAHVAISEHQTDRPRTALARHLAALAEKQSRALYDHKPGKRSVIA